MSLTDQQNDARAGSMPSAPIAASRSTASSLPSCCWSLILSVSNEYFLTAGQYLQRPAADLDQRRAGDRHDLRDPDARHRPVGRLGRGARRHRQRQPRDDIGDGRRRRRALSGRYVALAVGILVGLACGAIVGIIVSRFSVPAFVATLGMLSAARGMTLIYGGGKPVPAPDAGVPLDRHRQYHRHSDAGRHPGGRLRWCPGGCSTGRGSAATSMPSAATRMRPRPPASTSPASASSSISSRAPFRVSPA